MNTPPILPKVLSCKDEKISLPMINCIHWSSNSDCVTNCAINAAQSPDYNFCIKCDKRKSIEESKIISEKIINNDVITPELQEKLNLEVKKLQEKNKKNIQKKIDQETKKETEKSFLEKATSYLKAESSQATQGKISKENFEKRKEICLQCEFRTNDVVQKNGQPLHDTIGWCKGGCGCTVGNPRAALSEKLYMPTLICPKRKFGEEKGEGFKVEDTIDSVKGIIKSVKNLLGKDPSNK